MSHSVLDSRSVSAAIANIRRTVTEYLVPGVFVRHPAKPEWGIGQVQSVIGQRITVNFEHAGKLLINGATVTLEVVGDEEQ
jgi:transcription elongation factor GreA-like protein